MDLSECGVPMVGCGKLMNKELTTMTANLLAKGYEPRDVEDHWYRFWEDNRLFYAEEQSDVRSYSIVIPPPNVTGVLHMGHALNNTLQDILCRYRRLLGDNVLWMPGTDHAGIATQNVVEKKLALEGKTRHELGRARFIEEIWKWREKYGSAIINQLKRLGASCDWERERFTMDEGLSRAVRKVFVQLYEQGLIYKGHYIINWCTRCHTALADLEVEHEEKDGHLYYIKYPVVDNGQAVIVATTRPETMLGDTAVAVNPDDDRYRELKNKSVVLPLMNRRIPVIEDPYVDTSFGTGALKITPAHDPNDFEIGNRHKLPAVKVIGDDGQMTAEAGKFEGLDRLDARKAVIEALQSEGLLDRIEPYKHSVGHCYRCNNVIEPNLSKQWFVKAKPLADKAIEAVKTGKTRIVPEIWTNTYFDWMNNIRDWCISRQIWWGHQIPAWTCQSCDHIIVAMETPTHCPKCDKGDLVQETDVLDTWFSSALWPFSTMGWPEKTPLLMTFYPTSVLVTAFDILFFWVARMMMMGIHFMGDIPFRDVYVHALVRDENGKKMSKSTGNVIDPLTVIDEFGTDAFRFTLAAFAAQGRDIKMSLKRVEGYRHFINKLWNAARFALMHVDHRDHRLGESELSLADRWILSRLHQTTTLVAEALETYRFNDAAAALYKFVWHEFCDWYVEIIKPVLYDSESTAQKKSTQAVLKRVLHDTIILLHPFIPFVTEEIWHKLPGTDGSIMNARFPTATEQQTDAQSDTEAESAMELIMRVITGIRNIRGEMNIAPSLKLNATVLAGEANIREILEAHREMIILLARLASLSIAASIDKQTTSATSIIEGATLFVSLEGVIDFKKEIQRLEKEIKKVKNDIEPLSKKLENQGFLQKAPKSVVQNVNEKHQMLNEKRQKLEANLDKMVELMS